MKGRFCAHGNSQAVVVPSAVMKLLGYSSDTEIEFTTNGRALTLTPVENKKMSRADEKAMNNVFRRHKRTFIALANR